MLGALARPVSLEPSCRLDADPLARFFFRFEIADVLRQHIRAREAHIPSASVLKLNRFECRIGGRVGHGEHYERRRQIALPENSLATLKAVRVRSRSN
jgi:hypothetical protein